MRRPGSSVACVTPSEHVYIQAVSERFTQDHLQGPSWKGPIHLP